MPPSRGPAASCVGLVKTYAAVSSQVEALKGVDAEFPAGAVTAVVGPSGSGKSSLLRVLAGLDVPSAGTVLVGGRDLARLSTARLRMLRRRAVGYVFQRPADNFISYLTIDEHLELVAGGGPGERGAELLAELGLTARRGRLPRELSGGEQQRAAFAAALMAEPEIVVADEPTAELDSRSGEDLLRILQRLAATGVAFVVATHDRNVVRIADHVVELEHGIVRGTAAAPSFTVAKRRRSPTGATEPFLVAENLSKTYTRGREQVHALDDVTLALRSGEVVGLVGRSGSGKTTLLNVLNGWERPDGGAVIRRANGNNPDAATLPWTELAVVPQSFGLIDELTVRENVEYPARLAGGLRAARPWVDELLARFGLEGLVDRLPPETSIGEQQRTALARALVLKPRLLLADEPTGHQDARSTAEILGLLQEVASEGVCCLVATHDAEIARSFDVVYAMEGGRIRDATPSSL